MAITNYYYIKPGKKKRLFTLRHRETLDNGQVVDSYVLSLSIDPKTAIEKAQKHLAQIGGVLSLINASEFDEIARLSKSEREAEKAQAKEYAELQLRRSAMKMMADKANKFFFGRFDGYTPDQVFNMAPDYVKWVLAQTYSEDQLFTASLHFLARIQKEWQAKQPIIKTSCYLGQPGERIRVNVICTRVRQYPVPGVATARHTSLYICEDKDGNIIKISYSGKTWEMIEHHRYELSGMVKEHAEYNEVKQTTLSAVKLLG